LLPAQTLTQRVLVDQSFQLAHNLTVPADHEVCLDAFLQTGETELFQARDRRLSPRLVREVPKRGPTPKGKRLAKQLRGLLAASLGERMLAPLDQMLEATEIELVAFDPKEVAVSVCRQCLKRFVWLAVWLEQFA
jgi:hypothetical protein